MLFRGIQISVNTYTKLDKKKKDSQNLTQFLHKTKKTEGDKNMTCSRPNQMSVHLSHVTSSRRQVHDVEQCPHPPHRSHTVTFDLSPLRQPSSVYIARQEAAAREEEEEEEDMNVPHTHFHTHDVSRVIRASDRRPHPQTPPPSTRRRQAPPPALSCAFM